MMAKKIPQRLAVLILAAAAAFMALLAAPASAQTTLSSGPSAYDLEFKYSLDSFLNIRSKHPKPFDWSTDKCSVPKSIHVGGFSGKSIIDHFFTDQCIRHDFGYRNNRRINVGPGYDFANRSALREAIDKRLHSDMDSRCSKYAWYNPQREPCFAASDVVYQAVRHFGGSAFK